MYLTKRGPRSDAPTVVFHWLLVAALIVSLGSGLRVAADAVDARISKALSPLLMQGEVTYWHVLSASALCVLLLAYGVFLWREKLTARLALDVRKLGSNNRNLRWAIVNRMLHWVALGLLALAGVTGALVYFAPGIVPMNSLLTLHRGAAWGFVGYVVVHVAAQTALGGWHQLLKIVTPRAAYGSTAALALGLSAMAVAAVLYPLEHAMIRTLAVARVDQLPVIDGNPADRVWRQATPVAIHTAQGSNLPGGEVTVRVRAVHDGQRAAMLFEWPDSTRSQKHLPLIKTAAGWRVLQYRYGIQDEDTYYEDKFGVMLARSPRINGGGTSHLGPNPLPGRPGSPNARGLHFTDDGEFVDVWHWKSVRTGPLQQIDDNYFGPPKRPPVNPGERYTGGYAQDPKDGGGFEQNWKKIEGSEFVEPKRLPASLEALRERMGSIDLDPQASDTGQWWMSIEETVPYSKQTDNYPVGTVMPSVLIDKPFTGDRGDVGAVGTWHDGWWHLEVSRKLDTQSKFDVPIDSATYLWVSVFEHNQTRHSRHLHPVRLALEQESPPRPGAQSR